MTIRSSDVNFGGASMIATNIEEIPSPKNMNLNSAHDRTPENPLELLENYQHD